MLHLTIRAETKQDNAQGQPGAGKWQLPAAMCHSSFSPYCCTLHRAEPAECLSTAIFCQSHISELLPCHPFTASLSQPLCPDVGICLRETHASSICLCETNESEMIQRLWGTIKEIVVEKNTLILLFKTPVMLLSFLPVLFFVELLRVHSG